MLDHSGFERPELGKSGSPVSVGVMARHLAQMAGDRAHLDAFIAHLGERAIALHAQRLESSPKRGVRS